MCSGRVLSAVFCGAPALLPCGAAVIDREDLVVCFLLLDSLAAQATFISGQSNRQRPWPLLRIAFAPTLAAEPSSGRPAAALNLPI